MGQHKHPDHSSVTVAVILFVEKDEIKRAGGYFWFPVQQVQSWKLSLHPDKETAEQTKKINLLVA